MFRYLAAVLFGTAGIALGGINIWNNATQVNGGHFVWNDLTAVVLGLAVAGGLLSLAIGAVSRQSRAIAALAVIAVIGCSATSVGYTLARVGSVADSRAAEALAHNARIERATKLVDKIDAERKAEVAKGGCGRECRKIEARLAAARTALDDLGARRVVDPAGERLEAVTGGWISAKGYHTAHPVIVAGALELCVSLLLTVAGLFGAPSTRRAPRIIDITPVAVDPVLQALKAGPVSNRELARRLGWSEAKTSRHVAQLEQSGSIVANREGRSKMIACL
jgi:hypothetical protein